VLGLDSLFSAIWIVVGSATQTKRRWYRVEEGGNRWGSGTPRATHHSKPRRSKPLFTCVPACGYGFIGLSEGVSKS